MGAVKREKKEQKRVKNQQKRQKKNDKKRKKFDEMMARKWAPVRAKSEYTSHRHSSHMITLYIQHRADKYKSKTLVLSVNDRIERLRNEVSRMIKSPKAILRLVCRKTVLI